ncbi:MAG: hypothetical protein B6D35_14115 [Candidatus Brocadia sp. UTAMX2]|jgi:hypothetical protein|nr:MAG: hypothetical protein B6D35_14115 [Candidatus Brocadia sp. UTAMX2]
MAEEEKPEPKQAVVLIHGIGEQVPMDTLRGFVEAVWVTDSSLRWPNKPAQAWSKPDAISGNFELRRLTTADNRDKKRTDFFEFYWAHLMEGTTLSHVGAWAKVLVLRWPWRVPRQLRGIWYLLIALFLLAVIAGLNHMFKFVPIAPWVIKVGSFAWFIFNSLLIGFLIKYAGDAARYLHVAPPNIEIRRRIREAGIQLLEKLHSSPRYDRIIVVGHSLGSVIGYDILTHLWVRYHNAHVMAASRNPTTYTELGKLENMVRESLTGSLDIETYQTIQSAYLTELQSQGNKWKVTDFVTLGSPLAHASVLLARDERNFVRKKEEREFPACPPVLEDMAVKKLKLKTFSFEKEGVWVPHHAAVFAPTRWTNLYFPCHWTFWGDLIGGPVALMFGQGVKDIAVKTNLRLGLFSHTLYWSFPKNWKEETGTPLWIQQLRNAVRILQNNEGGRVSHLKK